MIMWSSSTSSLGLGQYGYFSINDYLVLSPNTAGTVGVSAQTTVPTAKLHILIFVSIVSAAKPKTTD
ncbi:hypothetical protein Sjap_014178 [Stephania japonica]|uniref:Uncharacterized protein n=1 Tax=Stephania japonica TaxID=461633 RepID=A0AAP0J1W0_9MAGN